MQKAEGKGPEKKKKRAPRPQKPAMSESEESLATAMPEKPAKPRAPRTKAVPKGQSEVGEEAQTTSVEKTILPELSPIALALTMVADFTYLRKLLAYILKGAGVSLKARARLIDQIKRSGLKATDFLAEVTTQEELIRALFVLARGGCAGGYAIEYDQFFQLLGKAIAIADKSPVPTFSSRVKRMRKASGRLPSKK